MRRVSGPCMIFGDFNKIMYAYEKEGGSNVMMEISISFDVV